MVDAEDAHLEPGGRLALIRIRGLQQHELLVPAMEQVLRLVEPLLPEQLLGEVDALGPNGNQVQIDVVL